MKLIIVESPAKCSTIERYLGKNYIVKASKGHVRDLSMKGKGGLGVNIEEGFVPHYVLCKGKGDLIKELTKLKNECDEVILATDPDREGEAIAWHLAEVLGLDVNTTKRLEFHEITRDSINHAIENPRTIDMNLVAAQEARRILDRIIGFLLSGIVQKKIKSRSAGRVQTPTLRLIYNHEKAIQEFVPEDFYDIDVKISYNGNDNISLTLVNKDGETYGVNSKEDAEKILHAIGKELKVVRIEKTIKTRESKEPFTTSTLQQEAFSKLKFKTQKTSRIAQKLYEGFDVGGEHMGLITYMRTDSTRLSPTYIQKASNFILETYGPEYLGKVKKASVSATAQDAHEAIRPTSNHKTPESVKQYLNVDEYNLYKLIYNRALSYIMKPRVDEVYTVIFEGDGVYFKLDMEKTIFKGYEILEPNKENKQVVYDFAEGQSVKVSHKDGKQKFTQPPSHYSEAKIVKIMEEAGIGRPSTYAPTIANLYKSKYITDVKGLVNITERGSKTAHVLEKYFPEVVEADYTAKVEKHLDEIESGNESRLEVLTDFYDSFVIEVKRANEIMYKDEEEKLDELCPECGSPLVQRNGKHGTFIGCSNYPKCSYVKKEERPEPVLSEEICPECGHNLVERKDKRGRVFLGCSNYPECKYIKPNEITQTKKGEIVEGETCPQCGSPLVKKKGKYSYFIGCTNYPTCNYMRKAKKK